MPEMAIHTRDIAAGPNTSNTPPPPPIIANESEAPTTIIPTSHHQSAINPKDQQQVRKRYISQLVKSTQDTINSYVEDSSDKSLVKLVSDVSEKYLVFDKLNKVIENVAGSLDDISSKMDDVVDGVVDGVCNTKQRLITRGSHVVDHCVATSQCIPRSEDVKNAVTSTVERTKSNVCESASSILEGSRKAYAAVVQRKNSIAADIGTIINTSDVPKLPSKILAYIRNLFSKVGGLSSDQYSKLRSSLTSMSESESFIKFKRSSSLTCEYIYNGWVSCKERCVTLWGKLREQKAMIKAEEFVKDGATSVCIFFIYMCGMASDQTKLLCGKVINGVVVSFSRLPEDKRETVKSVYVKMRNRVRSAVGEERSTAISNRLCESSIYLWLRDGSEEAASN